MSTDPTPDRPRALHLLEAAHFLRDAHFRDGLSVQEIGAALRHMADEADPMVGSLARDGMGLDEIAAMPATESTVTQQAQQDRCPHGCDTNTCPCLACEDTETLPASTAPLAVGFPLVKGNCPACHSASLFLGDGGYVTCSRIDCPEPDAATTALEQYANEAHQPTHAWKVESPRRDKWANWGATYDEREWAQQMYDSVIQTAPQRPFRLVRATTIHTVEDEHQPAATPVAGQPPADTGEEVRNVCVCSHTKGEHIAVSGRLLCDSCDPDSTENLVCKGFDAL